jgi:hypothetical protein
MAGKPTKSEGTISPFTWISLLAIIVSLAWAGVQLTHRPKAAPAAQQQASPPAAPAEQPAEAPAQPPPSSGERMNG